MLDERQKEKLLDIARRSVEAFCCEQKKIEFEINDPALENKQGIFVTLHKDGNLRGCIGLIESGQPLWQGVQDMALAAAFDDPRFDPVTENELENLEYEISVLSPLKKIKNWQDIKLGKHGVVIKKGMRSGVFLPQVAQDTGWDLEEFLSHLCSDKAGLAEDAYKSDPEIELLIFEVEFFRHSIKHITK